MLDRIREDRLAEAYNRIFMWAEVLPPDEKKLLIGALASFCIIHDDELEENLPITLSGDQLDAIQEIGEIMGGMVHKLACQSEERFNDYLEQYKANYGTGTN